MSGIHNVGNEASKSLVFARLALVQDRRSVTDPSSTRSTMLLKFALPYCLRVRYTHTNLRCEEKNRGIYI